MVARAARLPIVVTLLVGALIGLAPTASGQTPVEPGTPPVGLLEVPDPLPPGNPGDIIDSEPFDVSGFPYAVEAHQILYRSTDRFGNPIAVSGTVVVPVGVPAPAGGRGAVAWAHGTVGLGDGCAPSVGAQLGYGVTDPEDGYNGQRPYLDAGQVVVATDYPGIGTPGLNPYLDGVGAGRSVLDSLRGARAFGAAATGAVAGFSQGGHAAIYAGTEWSAGYASEIDLRAVVPVAAPTFMSAAYAAAAAVPAAGQYVGPILAGIVVSRPDLDAADLLTSSGLAALEGFFADDAAGGCPYPSFDLESDVRADPLSLPDWRLALEANEPGSEGIDVAVLMVAGGQDDTSLPPMTDAICAGLQERGTDVRLWVYPEEDHVGTAIASADDRAAWALARLAGDAPTDEVAFTGAVPDVVTSCRGIGPPVDPPTDPPVDPPTDPPVDPPTDPPTASLVSPGAAAAPAAPATPISAAATFTG